MPLDSNVADCIISNCVINLSEDKQKVFNGSDKVISGMVEDMSDSEKDSINKTVVSIKVYAKK